MKYLPFIWANLRRKPLRTVFTLISLTFAFTLLGLDLGLKANLRQATESARADRIHTVARLVGRLGLPQKNQIAQLPGVAAIGALDGVEGYYQRPGNNLAIMMVDAGMRTVVPELLPSSRQWQLLASRPDGVLVSHFLAARYRLRPGSDLRVTAKGPDAWNFKILGVVPDIPTMPVGFAVGNYDYLEQVRPHANRGAVREFWLTAKDAAAADAVAHEIDARFSSSAVPTRSDSETVLIRNTASALGNAILALSTIAVVGVVMIMILTANALRHSIRERTTELAVLKTLGYSNSAILALVLVEAALPCIAGAVLGLGVAAAASAVMPLLLPAGVILPPPEINAAVIGTGIGAALLVALGAAAGPVLKITQLDVATALASL